MATGECFKNLEVTIGGHKGGKVNVLANVFPIYNAEGACIGGMCVYVDMTALNEAQRQITEKNQRMAEVAQALEETMASRCGAAAGESRVRRSAGCKISFCSTASTSASVARAAPSARRAEGHACKYS